jgi:hypothetical protein
VFGTFLRKTSIGRRRSRWEDEDRYYGRDLWDMNCKELHLDTIEKRFPFFAEANEQVLGCCDNRTFLEYVNSHRQFWEFPVPRIELVRCSQNIHL